MAENAADESANPDSPTADEVASDLYVCPHCAQPMTAGETEPSLFSQCPHCGEDIAVDPITEDGQTVENTPLDREHELDGIRIRQISTGRRAAIRARTYLFVGSFLSATGCLKLIV